MAVNDDHAPVLITRQNGAPVVMLSLDDYYNADGLILPPVTRAGAMRAEGVRVR